MATNSIYRDPNRRDQVFRLIDLVWPGDYQVIQLAETYGAPWHRASTPFARFDGDRAVAHVGVLSIPLVLAGQQVEAAGIHAVCTHPDYRGRGYNRQLMEEALAYCDSRFDTALLFTDEPAIYTRYGFRPVTEHLFSTAAPAVRGGAPLRRLSGTAAEDLALLKRLFQNRVPVSEVLGVLEPGTIFITNELFSHQRLERIHYCAELDCLIAFEVQGSILRLYDVVGERMPTLDDVAARIDADFARIEICFTPDLLRAPHIEQRPYEDDGYLMVRGPFAVENQAFAVPHLARC